MRIFFINFFLTAICIIHTDSAFASPKLFNKDEVKNSDISEFPKWEKTLKKNSAEQTIYEKKCKKNKKLFYCNLKEWKKFLSDIEDKDTLTKIKMVNDHMNKRKYILDIDNWGMLDYWASPGEFLYKNGDCEDYAITKYMSLKALGFKPEDMRVVVLFDSNLNLYHSVLAVYNDDDIYILDNQIQGVIRDRKIYHYSPIFSINEENWWRYI